MVQMLYLEGRRYWIGAFGCGLPPDDPLRFPDPGSARRALLPALLSEHGRAVLRMMLGRTGHYLEPRRLTDHQLLDACARELACRGLWLADGSIPEREGVLGAPQEQGPPVDQDEVEAERHRPRVTHRLHPTSWIQIELYGEDGSPVAGERYRITHPDGHVTKGRLGANGRARVDPLEPGTCYVTFPDLDGEAWEAR